MVTTTPQLEALCAATTQTAEDVAVLLGAVPDSTQLVKGYDWTYGDLTAHLLLMADGYGGYIRGAREAFLDLDDMARGNADLLDTVVERDPARLIPRILHSTQTAANAASKLRADEVVFWHGYDVPVASVVAMLLGEFHIHGRDIARSLGQPLTISRDTAVLMTGAMIDLLPLFVDPRTAAGVRASYELRLRGGVTVGLRFDDAVLTIDRDLDDSVDCHISADPAAFLLVCYRRRSQWNEMARGHLLAWGRKPWLGSRLVSLLRSP